MRIIAALYLLYGVGTTLWALLLGSAFFWWPADSIAAVDRYVPPHVQYLLPPALLVLGAYACIAGVGLLRRADWARPTATLMALVSLLLVPIGTIFGVFALWILSRSMRGPAVSAAEAPSASA